MLIPACRGYCSSQYLMKKLTFLQSAVRAELHNYLTRLLLGDSLTADYLICHLVSRIYLRRDVLCLGKISLNLFQVCSKSFTISYILILLQRIHVLTPFSLF